MTSWLAAASFLPPPGLSLELDNSHFVQFLLCLIKTRSSVHEFLHLERNCRPRGCGGCRGGSQPMLCTPSRSLLPWTPVSCLPAASLLLPLLPCADGMEQLGQGPGNGSRWEWWLWHWLWVRAMLVPAVGVSGGSGTGRRYERGRRRQRV